MVSPVLEICLAVDLRGPDMVKSMSLEKVHGNHPKSVYIEIVHPIWDSGISHGVFSLSPGFLKNLSKPRATNVKPGAAKLITNHRGKMSRTYMEN